MRTWKDELDYHTRRAYLRGFFTGILAGSGVALFIFMGRV